jgi:hypothetical protein
LRKRFFRLEDAEKIGLQPGTRRVLHFCHDAEKFEAATKANSILNEAEFDRYPVSADAVHVPLFRFVHAAFNSASSKAAHDDAV